MSFQVGDKVQICNDGYYKDIHRVVMVDGENCGLIDDKSYDNWKERPDGRRWSVTVVKEGDLRLYEPDVAIYMSMSQLVAILDELENVSREGRPAFTKLMEAPAKRDARNQDVFVDIRNK